MVNFFPILSSRKCLGSVMTFVYFKVTTMNNKSCSSNCYADFSAQARQLYIFMIQMMNQNVVLHVHYSVTAQYIVFSVSFPLFLKLTTRWNENKYYVKCYQLEFYIWSLVIVDTVLYSIASQIT
jgi:hypothetical protein